MSRAINLTIAESDAIARCKAEQVGISAIEPLPQGGVRLVCMSVYGAELMKRKLKSFIIKGDVIRHKHRPTRPLW